MRWKKIVNETYYLVHMQITLFLKSQLRQGIIGN